MLSRFNRLSTLLVKHAAIWKTPVFQMACVSFPPQQQALTNFVMTLSDAEVEFLQANDQHLLARITHCFPDAAQLAECIDFPGTSGRNIQPPRFWNTDIPGRKEQQILAFSEALGTINLPLLEWCCGKQHLSRFLGEVHSQGATGLDIDADLINQANALARKRHLHAFIQSECCDVLSSQAERFIERDQHLIALHACGGLHTRMLQLAADKRVARLSLSPCCYHRFNEHPDYQALSSAAQQSGLRLDHEALRLAVRETQTASGAETQKRKTLQIWRLGFDSLQRELRQSDRYLPVPSFSQRVLNKGFPVFCQEIAALNGLKLHAETEFSHYLTLGEARFHVYQRRELLRMIFRRALECWLVLDKTLFLEEQGYDCKITRFCPPEISPRNLLIQAKLA
jgi:hypothetical protein